MESEYMQKSLDVMRLALRVLTALNHNDQPRFADIRKLHELAGPEGANLGDDELACAVIQKALEYRAAARRSLARKAGTA
jgi:hypothetical protein